MCSQFPPFEMPSPPFVLAWVWPCVCVSLRKLYCFTLFTIKHTKPYRHAHTHTHTYVCTHACTHSSPPQSLTLDTLQLADLKETANWKEFLVAKTIFYSFLAPRQTTQKSYFCCNRRWQTTLMASAMVLHGYLAAVSIKIPYPSTMCLFSKKLVFFCSPPRCPP